MKYIKRILDLTPILQQKSCFLFGPRQTGKTSLISHTFSDVKIIDLLNDEIYLRLSQNPSNLSEYFSSDDKIVVIDEIQRIPNLLNEVHRQIEKNKACKFLLTGSSARKLRKNGVNLLGGRARKRNLHPLVYGELTKENFVLHKALQFGTIPSIYGSDNPWEDLAGYVGTYLKEEIAAEAITRNIPGFIRFLEVAALCNSRLINYEKISKEAAVPRSTVQGYFQILRDTLIGGDLEPWRHTTNRKAILTSKFYFFDIGVVHYLQKIKSLEENSKQYGDALESYLFHELKAYCDYFGIEDINYWRSQSGFEVDFLVDSNIAIKVKSSRKIISDDLKGLLALSEEISLKRKIVVCKESVPRIVNGIEIFPLEMFLEALWAGKIVGS